MSICSLRSSSISFAYPHIYKSVFILSRNAIESSLSFSVIVTKISGSSSNLTAFFLRRSSHWTLDRSMADDTSLIGLEESHSSLVSFGGISTTLLIDLINSESLSITDSDGLEVSNVSDVEAIGTSDYSTI